MALKQNSRESLADFDKLCHSYQTRMGLKYVAEAKYFLAQMNDDAVHDLRVHPKKFCKFLFDVNRNYRGLDDKQIFGHLLANYKQGMSESEAIELIDRNMTDIFNKAEPRVFNVVIK